MKEIKKWLIDLIKISVVSFLCATLIIHFVFISVSVSGSSMHSTLKDRNFGISFVFTKKFMELKRFDIVTLNKSGHNNLLVKRIIGLPNEKISYKDNKLYINDIFVAEEFLNDQYTEDFEYQLKDDQYFVMGDNRIASYDSRMFGYVLKEEIKTSGIFILYPFSDFGFKK